MLLSVATAEILPIVASVAVVTVYAMMKAADSPTPEEFAPLAGKWVGPIGGFIATLNMARWCARRATDRPMLHGLAIGIGTALLDIALRYSMGGGAAFEPIFVASNLGRFIAGLWGGWLASKEPSSNVTEWSAWGGVLRDHRRSSTMEYPAWSRILDIGAGLPTQYFRATDFHRTDRRPDMTLSEVVEQLKSLGTESYKKILLNHGAREPVYGVKIADLKAMRRRVKKDHLLALDLYDTGAYDAQYLAGLIADESRMTKKDLKHWLAKGNSPAICASMVAWVTAESRHGRELALDWIASKTENKAYTGWKTLSSLVAVTDDADLDLPELTSLLKRVEQTIHQQPNHVRYGMNDFVIAVGTYCRDLTRIIHWRPHAEFDG